MLSLVARLILALLDVYYWLIIVRVITSWFPQIRNVSFLRPILDFIFDITEPFLALFRKIIPTASFGGVGIDFSPLIAIITLIAVRQFLTRILFMAL